MKTLEKTNCEMYTEAIAYFEPKARASGEFELHDNNLPKLFYENAETRQAIKKLFNMESRTITELVNLQDYSFIRTSHVEWKKGDDNDKFQWNFFVDCFQDVLTHVIDEVIEQKDPEIYQAILKKYN